jgi:cephalosporin hydroxylase
MVKKPRVAESIITKQLMHKMQAGIMSYKYRGIATYKCPFDMAIYMELLYDLKPRTILEFGSNTGGSALWFADTAQAIGLSQTTIHTFDIVYLHEYQDPRINFVKCDVSNIRSYLSDTFISSFLHPILMIDDASHQYRDSLKILNFFDEISNIGDYMIVEDGIASVVDEDAQYDGGPHRAIFEFLELRGADYEIDRARCDRYGHNVTWNIDGYIKRVGVSAPT